jgi:hypothetical protein
MDAQILMLGAGVGALTGGAHVASLSWGVALIRRGRVALGAALGLLRFGAVALALVTMARIGPAALEAAAGALIAARALAIARLRSAP